MTKNLRLITIAGVAMGLLMLLTVRPALAGNGADNDTFSIDVPNLPTCDGSTVELIGTAHLVHNATFNKNGLNFTGHVNIEASGVGEPDGLKYVGGAEANFSLHDSDPNGNEGNFVLTIPVNAKLIAQGSAQNFNAHVLIHLTVNAQGQVTSAIFNVTGGCD